MKSKILTALLAAAIAVCLWGYVITVERPESEKTFYKVPVVLEGENVLKDRGMMITSGEDTTVTLKLAGRRSDLKNLKSSDIVAVVNLSRITEPGQKNMSYSISIPGDSNIDVVKRTPDTVAISVVEWASKPIPVNLKFEGHVPEDYGENRQGATKDHDTITVTGPKDIINQIAMAKVTIDLDGRTETFAESFRYALCDAEGTPIDDVSSVTTDYGEIRVSMSIHQLKEVKLVYTIVDGGGLTASDVEVSISPKDTITVAGSPMVLEELKEINLGTFDLGELTQTTEFKKPVKLPEGVSNRSNISEVTVTVTVPEMETRTYNTSQFRIENVPEGLEAQLIAEQLEVHLRGRGRLLDQIKPEHITAVVDLTDQEVGNVYLPVKIEIETYGEDSMVGAVGQHSVQVKLFVPEPTPEPEPVPAA